MKKHDVVFIIVDPTRNSIVGHLSEAGKAACSYLVGSAEYVKRPTSIRTFNHHLNFLLANSLVMKDGAVYKLTRKALGGERLRWPCVNGGTMHLLK